jgi:subfamily B ATP-binding cassette protein HlyB/CyaB
MYSALVALEVVGQLNKIAVDSKAIIKRHALGDEEVEIRQLIRIAKEEGFKAKLKKLTIENLEKYPLPAIAQLNTKKYVTILKIDKEKNELLIYDKENNQPYVKKFDEFKDEVDNEIIILKHKTFNEQIKFGFKWFYNQIMNYKNSRGDTISFLCDTIVWSCNSTVYPSNLR